MNLPFLQDFVILLSLSVLVVYISHLIKLPVVVGLLITGILAGPHCFGLISATDKVDTFAEIGVILLMFTIGIEFSLKNLLQTKHAVFISGACQVITTIIFITSILYLFNFSLNEAFFIGGLFSLSSTAIVLKILQSRAEIDTPYGRESVGILIFQDLAVVPMVLLLPFLSGQSGTSSWDWSTFFLKLGFIIISIYLSIKWIIPGILHVIVKVRNRELFSLTIVLICFAIAWAMNIAGLSLALGAFIAGLIISESDYSDEALGNILPFRDIFTSSFFISTGMLINLSFFTSHFLEIIAITVAVMVAKGLIITLVTFFSGLSFRNAMISGFILCQVGEFSFVLAKGATNVSLLSGNLYQVFLSVFGLSMALTPFLILLAPGIADRFENFFKTQKLLSKTIKKKSPRKGVNNSTEYKDHLIIVGYGIIGRNVAAVARKTNLPYVIIELNPATVRKEKKKGVPIFYGDAGNEAVIDNARVAFAKILVIAIPDYAMTRRIIVLAKRINPILHVIARTRFMSEVFELETLGADEVIPEEFETSVEIFTRVMIKYLMPREVVEEIIKTIRSEGYEMLRVPSKTTSTIRDLQKYISTFEINIFRVEENSIFLNKSLKDLDLRKKHGITLLAIQRKEDIITNPDGQIVFKNQDLLLLLGDCDKIKNLKKTSET